VAVFRGVRGEVFGLPLHTRAEGSCRDAARGCEPILLRDLQPYARTNVRRGMISSAGLDGAREIIGRLRTNDLLPLCPPASVVTSSGDPQASPSPFTTITPDQPVPPTTDPPTSTAEPSSGLSGQHPEPATTGTPVPDMPSEPGVDCRAVS
jgi:protein phosphatase